MSPRPKMVRAFMLVCAISLLGVRPAVAAPGDLDGKFGTDGIVQTDFAGKADIARAVAIQSDGKIVAVGSSGHRFAVVRYLADGSPDPSFSFDGLLKTDVGEAGSATAVAVQDDGLILVAGGATRRFVVVRYLRNGSIDRSFGGDGIVKIGFDDGAASAEDIVVQTDGRILLAGGVTGLSGGFFFGRFALARLEADGSFDRTFGTMGRVVTRMHRCCGGGITAVALQDDGRIVATGGSGREQYALARYDSQGVLDDSFGEEGVVFTEFHNGRSSDVAIQPDDRIVVAGTAGYFSPTDFGLVRYRANGSLDDSFGGDAKIRTDFGGDSTGTSVVVQPNGKVIVGGGVGRHEIDPYEQFALAKYRHDGSRDTSFGSGGRVVTEFPFRDGTDIGGGIRDLALQGDGGIVAVGGRPSHQEVEVFVLARYLPV